MHLPEMESVRRWLAENVTGRRVRAVHASSSRVLDDAACEAARGCVVEAVQRVGGALELRLGGNVLGLSPGAGGGLFAGRPHRDVPAPWRLVIEWDAHALWLIGRTSASPVTWRPSDARVAVSPGEALEPLSAAFTLHAFKKVLRGKRRTIWRLLADGKQIAGLGDLYADEILHVSRVRPAKTVPTLDDDEVRAVYYAIVEVLQKAIRFGGTAGEQGPHVDGDVGRFDRFLVVHGRKGKPCLTCGRGVRRSIADGRYMFWCPYCQR